MHMNVILLKLVGDWCVMTCVLYCYRNIILYAIRVRIIDIIIYSTIGYYIVYYTEIFKFHKVYSLACIVAV